MISKTNTIALNLIVISVWLCPAPSSGQAVSAADAARAAAQASAQAARAMAGTHIALAGQGELWAAMAPRLDVSARYTRLSAQTNDPLVAPPSAAQLAGARALASEVQDPAAAALLSASIDTQAALGQSRVPVYVNQASFGARIMWPATTVLASLLPRYEALGHRAEVARAQAEAARQQAALQGWELFVEANRAAHLACLAEERAAQWARHEALFASMVQLGAATPADVATATAQRAQAEMTRAAAIAGERAARAVLAAITEGRISVSAQLAPLEPIVHSPLAALEELISEAWSRRPEATALRSLAEAAAKELGAEGADQWPQLALVLNAEASNPNPRFVPQRDQFDLTWDASVVVSWSPNAFVAASARKDSVHAQILQIAADERALKQGIEAELASAAHALHSAVERQTRAQALCDAANEALRVRELLLAEGLARPTEVLDAQADVSAALVERSLAVHDGALAQGRMHRALGSTTLWFDTGPER